MSNERIDLTQFEKITQGDWEVILLPGGGIDIGVRYTNHGHKPVVNFTQRMAEQVQQIERDVADMNAIASVPKMIAELKKRYEEIDNLHVTLHKWGLALCPRSNEWFEWDFGCQSEKCASYDEDCRELIDAA